MGFKFFFPLVMLVFSHSFASDPEDTVAALRFSYFDETLGAKKREWGASSRDFREHEMVYPLSKASLIKEEVEADVAQLDQVKSGTHGWEICTTIGAMTDLQRISLVSIPLTGSIPSTLGHLKHLTHLILSHNSLQGSFPEAITKLVPLVVLDFSFNTLTGALPESLSKLRNLEVLKIEGNGFSGLMPRKIGYLKNLRILSARDNQLQGEIPKSLSQCHALENLDLANNALTGTVPRMDRLVHLTELYLCQNKLSGRIPMGFGQLKNLTDFFLFNNPDLRGPLPLDFWQMSGLTEVQLHGTQIKVTLDAQLYALKNLAFLYLPMDVTIQEGFDFPQTTIEICEKGDTVIYMKDDGDD